MRFLCGSRVLFMGLANTFLSKNNFKTLFHPFNQTHMRENQIFSNLPLFHPHTNFSSSHFSTPPIKRILSARLDRIEKESRCTSAFFVWVSCTVHETHKYFFKQNNFKTGSHGTIYILKIILLQCFQFLIFSNKRYPNRPLM